METPKVHVRVPIGMLEDAYLFMLQSRDWNLRGKNQETLCSYRDTLADALGWTSQRTQEHYEGLAQEIQNRGQRV